MSDLVFSSVVLFISAGAMALSFTFADAVSVLLPRLAAGLGIAAALWMVVKNSLQLARNRRDAADLDDHGHGGPTGTIRNPAEGSAKQDEPVSTHVIDENDAEYVLSQTPRKIWLVTLGFIVGFFVLLSLFGIFIATAALSLTYLVVIGKKSWTFSIVYTVVFTALLWALTRWLTYISTPAGVLIQGG
ncbi:MAG: hypothetical protein Q7T17_05365 [Microbacterium sp.]|uniref:hypothetical protein n=1 Tax=Microbacterium sp. TaxID=51671 RepID=UPI00271842D1|nr:hypothetical protein [Microbacterium sp.]MDO8382389.1 hypothetical protein [Microbacterium sp.]